MKCSANKINPSRCRAVFFAVARFSSVSGGLEAVLASRRNDLHCNDRDGE